MDLTDPVTKLPGVGEVMAKKLAKLDVFSLLDLIYHLPFRYEDRSVVSLTTSAQIGEKVTIIGKISAVKNGYTKSGKVIQTASLTDSSGSINVIWFNQPYLAKALTPSQELALFGQVSVFNHRKTLISPDYEFISTPSLHTGRLVPVYPETAGVSSKWLRGKIYYILNNLLQEDYLLQYAPRNLAGWKQALWHIHFPQNLNQIEPARTRLAFDELLLLKLRSLQKRLTWQKSRTTRPIKISKQKIEGFISNLPFSLTSSQKLAAKEILDDLNKIQPMNRLLEGDVGSGKTIVAAISSYAVQQAGLQTMFLAPTQILATQHFSTLRDIFGPLKISVKLVLGGSKKGTAEEDIIVGTHALLSKQMKMERLGLVVIDEQHRFGVAQRALATAKGKCPHTLTMTATPIPRTVSLVKYGDLDLSVLTDLPAGRNPVKTWTVPETKRDSGYQWVANYLRETSSQAFWICPFIEESDNLSSVKAATVEYQKLKQVFPKFSLGLLHGRLKTQEKQKVLDNFLARKYQILVATPIVEVGIDIPNATIMAIEGADRFGLAQLHQLRGRVGRSNKKSYCLLFADSIGPRLKEMEKHQLGIELAEIDLKLRGTGEIYGTSQHGHGEFKIAKYSDLSQMEHVNATASQILPVLSHLPMLRSWLSKGKIDLVLPN